MPRFNSIGMVRLMSLHLRPMISLAERCESSPLTRTEIARRVGVSRQTLWYWEGGKVVEKVNQVVALALVFGCDPADINPELRGES